MKNQELTINVTASAEQLLQKLEAAAMLQALKLNKYNKSRAAKALGLSRGAFMYKIDAHFPNEFVEKRTKRS